MRVLKFGGAALRDGQAVQRAANIVDRYGGPDPLVVVSAHEGVTEQLERAVSAARRGRVEWDPLRIRHRTLLRQLELPGDLLDRHLRELRAILESLASSSEPDPRFRDFVLSFGERMSARVFAAALARAGRTATPLDATDLGLVKADGPDGLPEQAPGALVGALARVPGVPVVTGFLALDTEGFWTTLGRNGSDLTAAWFGAALRAEEVQLWKRVPGLMTADPRVVPGARRIPRLSWSEAHELARHGSGVLHPRSIEPARRARAPIHLRDLDHADAPGSRIDEGTTEEGACVRAVTHRLGLVRTRATLAPGRPRADQLRAVFDELAAHGAEPLAGLISDGAVELLLERAAFRAANPPGTQPPVREVLESDLATVTLIGHRLDEAPGVAEALQEAVAAGAREVHSDWAPSETAGSTRVLLTPESDAPELVRRLHARFFGN